MSAAEAVKARPVRRAARLEAQRRWFPYILYGPTLTVLIILTIFPLLYSLYISFFDVSAGQVNRFVGFRNFGELLRDPVFWSATWLTIKITVMAVAAETVLGIALAFLFNTHLPGIGLLRFLMFIPMMLSPMVVAYFWKYLYDTSFGLINYLIGLLGGEPLSWFTEPALATLAIVIVDVWQWTPFVFLIMLAGLQGIPEQVLESASLVRSSLWFRFRWIYLPYLQSGLLIALLLRTIDAFKMFDSVYVLTGGGPGNLTTTLSLYAYRQGFQFFYTGKAAALSWLMVIMINVATIMLLRTLAVRRSSHAAPPPEPTRPYQEVLSP